MNPSRREQDMSMEISSGSPEPQRQGALPEPARTLVRRAEEVQERADASYAEVLEQTRFMGTAMPPDYVRVEREFQNVDQTVIRVTEDRAELILEKALKQSRARLASTAPASVLLAITLALQAAAFHDWLSISAATWEAFFMLA